MNGKKHLKETIHDKEPENIFHVEKTGFFLYT